ncbi:protein RICE SALT SENSITIVE 3-like [Phoenix dactylifera]|uniref:Protein RICE SALT SENSITIVE 3-like n=1 Tax=Phoenix dactylifera TaxID=42345 RepID=A0A8B7CTV3_PHODC|nr:protein RICE SALT SENSITIVE 3-like [Phoenix dactylifera]
MVGSGAGGDGRSKEALGMMALHEALRNVCLSSDWTYSVFWTIRPRPRCRGGSGCKVGDDNGSLMLMWEDGFCRSRVAECLEEIDGEDPVRKAFSKMSIQLYNYGEGLMGKVASDKCHKWVFKEPSECEPNINNYWQSSFDALPPEWTDQFASGIQTIAVIQAGHGLLQLGSCKIIPEDLHFVLRMRHMFESLGYQSGFFLSQLFSSSRNTSPSSPTPLKQPPTRPPPPIFNWSHPPLPSTSPIAPPAFHPSPRIGFPNNKDDTQLFFLPHSSEPAPMDDMIADHESDLKWPNGLSFFTALTGRADEAKLLFGAEGLGSKPPAQQHPLTMTAKNPTAGSPMNIADDMKAAAEASNFQSHGNRGETGATLGASNTDDYLSLESHSNKARKMENNKFKRSFTLPARMTSSLSSSSLDHHHAAAPQAMEYRSSESGIYSDIMETFLD